MIDLTIRINPTKLGGENPTGLTNSVICTGKLVLKSHPRRFTINPVPSMHLGEIRSINSPEKPVLVAAGLAHHVWPHD